MFNSGVSKHTQGLGVGILRGPCLAAEVSSYWTIAAYCEKPNSIKLYVNTKLFLS